MTFLIADTFTDSLTRLTGDEQKAAKTTAFDLQVNPVSTGLSFHKLDKARDKNFWSVRVTSDIRLIVHKTASSLLLCYVDHHDKAYHWAERRKLQTHPTTGAAQLVEIRESVQDIFVPRYLEEERPRPAVAKPLVLAHLSHEELLGFGVPAEWIDDVHKADEDSLLTLCVHLPAEAAEALLQIATGSKPRVPTVAAAKADPFAHPDARRRFRVVSNVEDLERALEYPWEKWTVFLHPDQREFVEKDFNGPARVSGSAGTGKTIVALHRAVFLAKSQPSSRVLLTTFSDTLASALKLRLERLVAGDDDIGLRIQVESLDSLGTRLYEEAHGPVRLATREDVAGIVREAAKDVGGHKFPTAFLVSEWSDIVDAWQLATWEEYRDVARLGRKTRLSEAQRKTLWEIFTRVTSGLQAAGSKTPSGMFAELAQSIQKSSSNRSFDFVVVDESQDLGISHLKLFAALVGDKPNGLFFAGDLGQRIFQQPFSWKAIGVNIRGRSRTLRVNYRTSHQIRMQADRLLGPEVSDVDGEKEVRGDTVSVFNGPVPEIRVFPTADDETAAVGKWIAERVANGVLPHEIGVFVRSEGELDRARAAAATAKQAGLVLDRHVMTAAGSVSISTMHLAKGLEFRAVAVMACDDEVIPLQSRIANVGDDADLQEVYDTERQLMYVACTRARDHLLVTGSEPASEFLDDLSVGE